MGGLLPIVLSAKQNRYVYKDNDHRSSTVGERWMIDRSSVKSRSREGSKYWLLVLDEASDFAQSFFLTKKSDTAETLIDLFKSLKSKGHPVKYNSLEFQTDAARRSYDY